MYIYICLLMFCMKNPAGENSRVVGGGDTPSETGEMEMS